MDQLDLKDLEWSCNETWARTQSLFKSIPTYEEYKRTRNGHPSDDEQNSSSNESGFLEDSKDSTVDWFDSKHFLNELNGSLPHLGKLFPTISNCSEAVKNQFSDGYSCNDIKEKQEENSQKLSTGRVTNGLDQIVGLEDVKQKLREALVFPIKYPHLFSGPRTAWTSALLFGPPGVGKTTLVTALAAEVRLPLHKITSSDMLSSFYGETEKKIKALFEERSKERCLVFIDEIDALCKQRSGTDNEQARRLQSELLVRMEINDTSGMFLICATNCPWDIDPAFMRRFQQQIYLPLPDREARAGLFKKYLNIKTIPTQWSDWDKLIDESTGMTGCDIKLIVRSASMAPIREMQTATHWEIKPDGKCIPANADSQFPVPIDIEKLPAERVWCREIILQDLQEAMKSYVRTVTQDTLKPYEIFLKKHSNFK